MRKLLAFAACVALAAFPAFGDTIVTLKTGGTLRGKLVSSDDNSITLRLSFGEVMVLKTRIETMENVAEAEEAGGGKQGEDLYSKEKGEKGLVEFEGHFVIPERKEFLAKERQRNLEEINKEGADASAKIDKFKASIAPRQTPKFPTDPRQPRQPQKNPLETPQKPGGTGANTGTGAGF